MIQYEQTKPDYVDFIRMPAVLSERWRPAAKAFYTAVALDALEKVHGPMFAAIHQERRPMQTDEEVKELFVSARVDGTAFDKRSNSFGVDSQVRRAAKRAADYGITGVPTIIINGRYRTGRVRLAALRQRSKSSGRWSSSNANVWVSSRGVGRLWRVDAG